MSLIKAIKAQFGISSTATQNFTMTAEAQDGTLKLARGNAGATTQDVLTVDAAGNVGVPANLGLGTSGDARLAIVGTGYSKEIALTDAANISWDTAAGQVAKVTLGGNRTLSAPSNLKAGAFYALSVVQDATGGRTLGWNSVFKFTAGTAPTLTTAANARDDFVFRSDGVSLYEQGRSQAIA